MLCEDAVVAERTLFRDARAGDEQASASSSTVPAEAPAATRRSRWRLWPPPAAAAATPGGARAARRSRFPSGRGRGDARDERRCGEGCPAARPDIACRRAPVARGASPRPEQSSSEAPRSRAFAPDEIQHSDPWQLVLVGTGRLPTWFRNDRSLTGSECEREMAAWLDEVAPRSRSDAWGVMGARAWPRCRLRFASVWPAPSARSPCAPSPPSRRASRGSSGRVRPRARTRRRRRARREGRRCRGSPPASTAGALGGDQRGDEHHPADAHHPEREQRGH
jgi:hypothetical protein